MGITYNVVGVVVRRFNLLYAEAMISRVDAVVVSYNLADLRVRNEEA